MKSLCFPSTIHVCFAEVQLNQILMMLNIIIQWAGTKTHWWDNYKLLCC